MRWKSTLVLAVLLAGLGTFYYVYEIRQRPAREKAAAEKDRLWKGLEAKDVEAVLLTRGTETIRLTRSGDVWRLTAPVADRADQRTAEDLVTALVTLRVEREIEANPAKPAEFGLEPPALAVTFTSKEQERGVRLGAKNPTGTWVYAQETGKPRVVLVPDALLRGAQKSVDDFRDRTVLAFDRPNVKGLEIQARGGPSLAAELTAPEEWQVTAPATLPADREAISALLDGLRTARIKEFVAGPASGPRVTGLDQPLRLTLFIGEGTDRVAKALRLGRVVPDKTAVYAQREGETTVFLVEDALVRAVPTSLTALRDKTVFAYDRGQLERLELESPKGTVALAKDGDAWQITAPAKLRADAGAVSQVLGTARGLQAKAFVAEEAAALGRFGLDRPRVRLAVWEKDAKAPKTLLLGPARDRDGAYATVVGGAAPAPVVLVEAKVVDDLSRSLQELRDRALFASLDTQAVARVRIQRGDRVLELSREGPDAWTLNHPRDGQVRATRVSDVIWTISGLRWREVVADAGWEPSRYGLDPPATTVTLSDDAGTPLAALAIGNREKDQTYVRVPGRPELYLVESRGLDDIPASPGDLL